MSQGNFYERCPVANFGAVVGTGAAVSLVASNIARRCITITNAGTTALVVGKDNTVTATTNGIIMPANSTLVLRHYLGALFIFGAATATGSYIEECAA